MLSPAVRADRMEEKRTEKRMAKRFPIFLDIADREIHVYGAGRIGLYFFYDFRR